MRNLIRIQIQIKFKSIFLPRVAEFIYIEGDNKRVCLLWELYIFIYNDTIVSRALPSSSVDYNWFTVINVYKVRLHATCKSHFIYHTLIPVNQL